MEIKAGDLVKILDSGTKDIRPILDMIGGVYKVDAVYGASLMINNWHFAPSEVEKVDQEAEEPSLNELREHYVMDDYKYAHSARENRYHITRNGLKVATTLFEHDAEHIVKALNQMAAREAREVITDPAQIREMMGD